MGFLYFGFCMQHLMKQVFARPCFPKLSQAVLCCAIVKNMGTAPVTTAGNLGISLPLVKRSSLLTKPTQALAALSGQPVQYGEPTAAGMFKVRANSGPVYRSANFAVRAPTPVASIRLGLTQLKPQRGGTLVVSYSLCNGKAPAGRHSPSTQPSVAPLGLSPQHQPVTIDMAPRWGCNCVSPKDDAGTRTTQFALLPAPAYRLRNRCRDVVDGRNAIGDWKPATALAGR